MSLAWFQTWSQTLLGGRLFFSVSFRLLSLSLSNVNVFGGFSLTLFESLFWPFQNTKRASNKVRVNNTF